MIYSVETRTLLGFIVRTRQKQVWQLACAIVLGLLWPYSAQAATSFYVDPDWGGTETGAAASPWRSLSAAAWVTINNALGADDVTVYFSAREAGAAVNETTTSPLSVRRSDSSAHRLILDGNSQYNTNDSVPTWAAQSGAARFQITANLPVSTVPAPNSNTTLRGFRIMATQGQIIFWWGGDNVTIEDNEGSSASTATYGPGIYFGYTMEEHTACPTASGRESCRAFRNVTIRRNYVHDTYGEGIYVGGCANTPGCLAHIGVTIEGNMLRNVAVLGGEPDAIDVKDGVRNLVVRGNDIRLQRDSRDGISLESGAIVESNYVEGAGRMAICLSAYWNNSGATRLGSVVRNNIVVKTGGNTAVAFSSRAGIYVDGDTSGDSFTNVAIYNNTIYRVFSPSGEGEGIAIGAVGTTVRNNLVFETGGFPLNALSGTLAGHSHNLFYKSTPGAIVARHGSSTFTSAEIANFDVSSWSEDPLFVNQETPYSPEGFQLQDGSRAINGGTPVTTFSEDYFGALRPSAWDIGAVEKTGALSATPPSNLRLAQ